MASAGTGGGHLSSGQTSIEVVHAVDAFVVALEREVGCGLADTPHLDGAIQASTRKSVGVLGVKHHLHHIMRVPLKDLGAYPALHGCAKPSQMP